MKVVKLVPGQFGIIGFEVIGAGAIFVVLRIEEELLYKTKSSRESAVLGGYFFLQFN
jgi:hypothetical protein